MISNAVIKRTLVLLLTIVMVAGLIGCSPAPVKEPAEAPKEAEAATPEAPKLDYPKQTITIICPWKPGGTVDVMTRIMAEFLQDELGVTVIVTDMEGSSGMLGWTEVSQSKPDGYTIGEVNLPTIITSCLDKDKNAPYTTDSFDPVAIQVFDPAVVGVKGDSKFKTLEDLVTYAKANPGKVSVATSGVGSDDHLNLIRFCDMAGVEFNMVHLGGAAEILTNMLGGHIDAGFGNAGDTWASYVPTGEVRYLAHANTKPISYAEDVPSFKDLGYDIVAASARGYAMPAGTPEEITVLLAETMKKIAQNPEYQKKMADAKQMENFMPREEFLKFWDDEIESCKVLLPKIGFEVR